MTSRMTREQLLKRAAVAAPGLLLAGAWRVPTPDREPAAAVPTATSQA